MEIDRVAGQPNTGGLVKGFLLSVNRNTCAQLGKDDPPHVYGYGTLHIAAKTHKLTIEPMDQNGNFEAGKGGSRGIDPLCNSYVATPK